MAAPSPDTPVEFWFDFISPYAYLAWQRVHAVAEASGRAVVHRPVVFAGLLNHWGQLGPAEIAPKRLWTFKQVCRRAARLGVPMQPPPGHPFNPIASLRLVCALHDQPEGQRRLIDALFNATWGGGPGVHDAEALATTLSAAGFDAPAMLARTREPEVKQRLLANAQEAIERGVFGVPTMLVGDELFWGDDSFEDLDAYLRGEDPIDLAALSAWEGLRADAQRER